MVRRTVLAWPIQLAGLALCLFFVVWNVRCLILMRRHETALLPGGATALILDEGPFGASRNPLYVGLMVAYVGLGLVYPSIWALALTPVAFAGLWWGAVAPEESYLSEKFGTEYADYCARVRRWI